MKEETTVQTRCKVTGGQFPRPGDPDLQDNANRKTVRALPKTA